MGIKSFIKRHKILTGLTVSLVMLSIGTLFFIMKPNINLRMFDDALVWKYNKDLGNKKFVLYRNGEEILCSNQTKYRDDVSGDKSSPENIDYVDFMYNENSIIISWSAPVDKGSINVYKVGLKNDNNDVKIFSKEVIRESISGIAGYEVVFNGKTCDVESNEFFIDISDMKEGEYDFKIVAKDNAGNLSDEFLDTIEIYKPYLDGNEIKINSNKKYIFKAFVDGTDVSVFNNKIDEKGLSDLTAPNKVETISIWNRGSRASVIWGKVKDKGTVHDIELVGIDVSGGKVSSTAKIKSEAAGIKGYYYAITNSDDYILSINDKFVEDTELVDIKLPYETNYIHIAAMDNSGNVSEVTVKRIDENLNENYVIDEIGDKVIVDNKMEEE